MRPGRLVGVAAGVVVTFVLLFGAIPATRSRLDRLFVLTAVLYVGFVARRRLGFGTRPRIERFPAHADLGPPDEPDVRLARLDSSLALAASSGDHWSTVTRPALRRLATERLRLRAGIDVTADPAGARRVMGEELWQLFDPPAVHAWTTPGPLGLRDLVERLERL